MTSAYPSAWLPGTARRAAHVRLAVHTRPAAGRHRAPEAPGEHVIATPRDLQRRGRHAEPEYGRALFDPRRDEQDAFDWLGFDTGR